MKRVIHDWDDECSENCLRAMLPGGRVLVAEMIVPTGNDRHPIKVMDVNMLVVTGGLERTQEQYAELLARAGLLLTRVVPTQSPLSILEAIAA